MEREVIKNKYSNAIFPVKGVKKSRTADFERVEERKESAREIIKKSLDVDYSDMTLDEINAEIAAARAERRVLNDIKADILKDYANNGENIDESDLEVVAKGWKAFLDMRKSVAEAGFSEMTLDEINAEIAEARQERRTKT